MRNDENFKMLWSKTVAEAHKLNVSDPVLPRRRNVEKMLKTIIFFEALDLTTNTKLI